MRFLHTSDWHVGKPLRGRSRMDEYERALAQVADIAAREKVDAVLVAGDVFDSPAPPPEAEKLVYDFLARLIKDETPCVVIAGNHDHPRKLAALRGLLESLDVHVRTEPSPAAKGGIVPLRSRDGREEARVAVLPFVPERKVIDACAVMGPERGWYETYAKRVEQILNFLAEDFTPSTVNVVVAHLLVAGARFGTGERQLHLGDIYGVNAEQLPARAQYVALGHLHRPQELMAPTKAAYAGSLIELDFGEREQDKRVVIVEARAGSGAQLDSVPLTAGRRLRDVTATLAELRAQAGELRGDFLRVRVKAEGPEPGLADQVKELLPDALEVTVDYPRAAPAPGSVAGGPSVRSLAPADLFAQFYRKKNETPPSEELQQLFQSVYDEAHG